MNWEWYKRFLKITGAGFHLGRQAHSIFFSDDTSSDADSFANRTGNVNNIQVIFEEVKIIYPVLS